jgi:gluconokinase
MPDGGVEIDPPTLFDLTVDCLDGLHQQLASLGIGPSGVGASAFWHSFLGIDQEGEPTTNIIHLFDTRSGAQVEELKRRVDPIAIHARTGAVIHTSYWPAKLMWLAQNRPDACARTVAWLSFPEYFLRRVTGQWRNSISMASGSGLWNQHLSRYDEELISILPISLEQLAPLETLDQPVVSLLPEFAKRWPLFHGIPWFPASGDGACNNIGSGCTGPDRFALMVGTSGAMRVVIPTEKIAIPEGIWCYRVDSSRFILGGAVSNGGDVFKWATRTLNLPPQPEAQIECRTPGCHRITVLPFFGGERSPYWRPDIRAAILGLSLSSTPIDILQATLEGAALSFRRIYTLLTGHFPEPNEIIGSGGALLHSSVWSQMMADAMGRRIVSCPEPEASCRGAAMLAAEQMKLISDLGRFSPPDGATFEPRRGNTSIYARLQKQDDALFNALYRDSAANSLIN